MTTRRYSGQKNVSRVKNTNSKVVSKVIPIQKILVFMKGIL